MLAQGADANAIVSAKDSEHADSRRGLQPYRHCASARREGGHINLAAERPTPDHGSLKKQWAWTALFSWKEARICPPAHQAAAHGDAAPLRLVRRSLSNFASLKTLCEIAAPTADRVFRTLYDAIHFLPAMRL